jgi:hypothetical protein
MQSKATTVAEYLAELPDDRRAALEMLRAVIRGNLDAGYEEGMQYGMIGYYVPHRIYPPGYHCDPKQPLPFAGMASQKNYMSLYLGCIYQHAGQYEWFKDAWEKTGKKLDMGKACIRFKKVDDLALDVIAEVVRTTPAGEYVAFYEAVIKTRTPRPRATIKAKQKPKAKASKAATAVTKRAAKKPGKLPTKKKGAAKTTTRKKPATKRPLARKKPAKRGR